MTWTLLVPGALLAPAIAPQLARALRLPGLAGQLSLARAMPRESSAAAAVGGQSTVRPAPHWAWLAGHFGLDPAELATAPYAWRAAIAQQPAPPMPAPEDGQWVAHCTPVHMAIARDHFVVSDLGDAPLQPDEAVELLDLANAVLAAEAQAASAPADAGRLRLAQRDGQWFLVSPRPLAIQAWPIDAVLGQSVQDRLPVGTDARRWRILGNEIQMSWHASASAQARDAAGARAANALWLHGAGVWRPLAPMPPTRLRAEGAVAEAAVIAGWLDAAGVPLGTVPGTLGRDEGPANTLAICRDLFDAHAHQAWESWLERWPGVEARILAEMDLARRSHATRFDLVLSGAWQSRRITVPMRAPWWHRLLRPPGHAALLERWLTEAPAAADPLPRSTALRAGEAALSA
jgi:hypothetical protein